MTPASTIRVRAHGQDQIFTAPQVVHIGRDPGAEVVLTNPSVSRRHAELRWQDSAWYLFDLDSSHGVYVAGQAVKQLRLDTQVLVHFGLPENGEAGLFEPVGDTARPLPTGPPAVGVLAQTVLPHAGAPQANVTFPPLVVVLDGGPPRRFDGGVVRIGRRPDLEVVTSNPAVSREHARLEPQRNGWRFVDTSQSGSYHDGRPVRRLEITAPETLVLGDPLTGPKLQVAPHIPAEVLHRSQTRHRRWRRVVTAIAAALAVCVVLGAVFLGVQQRRDKGLSAEALQQAKRATVLLRASATDTDGNPVNWSGSGSLISPDGLVLTNAHVARPRAPGQWLLYGPPEELDPDYVTVSLTQAEDDKPAKPAYRAKVVIADGYLDAALVKIYATADGGPLAAPLRLPTVPIGGVAELRTGDPVWVLGFPGISDSDAVTVTRGVVSTFVPNERIGSARFEIDTDARIAPGNSGGAAIDEQGRLIGVPSSSRKDQSGALVQSGRIYTIDLMKPLLDKARAGGDPDYVTPYVTAETGREQVTARGWSRQADAGCAVAPDKQLPAAATAATAFFDMRGMTRGLDLQWTVYNGDPAKVVGADQGRWDRDSPEGCEALPMTFETPLAPGPVTVVLRGGPALREYAQSTSQVAGAASPAPEAGALPSGDVIRRGSAQTLIATMFGRVR